MSREVLAPPVQRMGANRCYRVNLVHEDFGGNPQQQQSAQAAAQGQVGYTEPDLYQEDDFDDEDEGSYNIEELANAFKLTMHVPPALYGGLIGFKGSTKRRIESETQTEIIIPRSREGGGGGGSNNTKSEDVVIKGKLRSNVCSARRKINLLITSLRKRMRPTHFLCVPLNYGEIKDNFMEFRKQILASNLPGIDEQLFQTELCMHLTVGTCVLLDDAERAKAVEVLQTCRNYLGDLKTPFNITVSGLEIMNDDPSAVRVLYACVDAPDLQCFADRMLVPFLQSGLYVPTHDRVNVKLHLTLLNSRYSRRQNEQAENSFDAREMLKRYGNFHFGTTQCNEVQLCVMRTSNESRCTYYKITGSMKF